MNRPDFAHASEAELARILDYYQVTWQYEPRTFPILFNLEGAVVESFAPDFFLPDLDLYVELTTLRQSLVRKKNRKLRRLRELYPDVRIKLFYAKDFKALLLKYGRFDLAASLSGEEGQARHPRGLPEPAVSVAVRPEVERPVIDAPPVVPATVAMTTPRAVIAGSGHSRAARRRRRSPGRAVLGPRP
ncbi:MAG: hypothetical protein ACRDF7_08130 [Candidatus Limnocylindrales bacterium]